MTPTPEEIQRRHEPIWSAGWTAGYASGQEIERRRHKKGQLVQLLRCTIGEVIDRYGAEGLERIQAAIDASISSHPPGRTCECPAIDALRVALSIDRRREGHSPVCTCYGCEQLREVQP